MAAVKHEGESADEERAKKRTRILHACVSCGKKKTKCNGEHPCNVCQASRIECTYAQPKKRGPPKGYVRVNQTKTESPASMRKRLAEMEAQLHQLEGKQHPQHPEIAMLPEMPTFCSTMFNAPPNAVAGPSRDLYLPNAPAFSGYNHDGTNSAFPAYPPTGMPMPFAAPTPPVVYPPTIPIAPPTVGGLARFSLDQPVATGSPPWLSPSRQADSTDSSPQTTESLYLGSLSGQPQLAPIRSAAPKIDMQSTAARVYGPGYAQLDQQLSLEEEMPAWVNRKLLHLAYIHPLWPIVTHADLQLLAADPGSQPMLFNSVCALAARTFSDYLDPPEHEAAIPKYTASFLAQVFFNRARYHAILSDLGPNLATCQSLLLMTLRENGCGRPAQGFQYCGMACRMAFDLGLHRKREEGDPEMSTEEAATRVRVYWACYIVDKMCAANLGRPVFMRREDADVELPQFYPSEDEDRLWVEHARPFVSAAVAHTYRDVKLHAFTNFYAFAGISRILEQIIVRIYSFARRKQEQDVRVLQGLHSMLESWRKTLPDHLRWHTAEEASPNPLFPPHILAVQTWFFTARLLLFRSFIPRFPACHSICNGAATEICRIIEVYEQNFGLRKVATSFVYASFSAAAMFAANLASSDVTVANQARVQLDKCITWLDRLSETWQAASQHHRILVSLRDAGSTGDLRGNEAASEVVASRVPPAATMPTSSSNLDANLEMTPRPVAPASTPSVLAQQPRAEPLHSGLDADMVALLDTGLPYGGEWLNPHMSVPSPSQQQGSSALSGFNHFIPHYPLQPTQEPVDASVSTFWRQMPLGGPQDAKGWDQYVEKYAEQVGEALAMRS